MKKKHLFLVPLAALLIGCGKSGTFTIAGHIAQAQGETLYFEKNGLLADTLIDSVRLDAEGQFKFKAASPRYPELYRLRLGNERLVLAVDSAETITITAQRNHLIDAKINQSPKSEQVQQLRKSVMVLQHDFDRFGAEKDPAKQALLRDSFANRLERHRREVQNLVLSNPASIVPYFALYQQIGGSYIFSPYVKEDLNYFRALATSFQQKMPDYDRTKNLYVLVIDAIREDRQNRRHVDWSKLDINESSGLIELELPNQHGYPQKLSSLTGKPVVLDFSAYTMENSTNHIFELREIYNRHAAQGLQIYQVSLDRNRTAWQHYVSNIPWITVLDETGKAAQLYNVSQIPTLFLINRAGTVVGRYSDVKALKRDLDTRENW